MRQSGGHKLACIPCRLFFWVHYQNRTIKSNFDNLFSSAQWVLWLILDRIHWTSRTQTRYFRHFSYRKRRRRSHSSEMKFAGKEAKKSVLLISFLKYHSQTQINIFCPHHICLESHLCFLNLVIMLNGIKSSVSEVYPISYTFQSYFQTSLLNPSYFQSF